MSSPAIWRIKLFGTLQITSGEQTITRFRTQMTGSLLAYLAYYKGRPQPREVLIEQFWPDADVKAGRGRLSVALSSLRSQFLPPPNGPELLLADSFTVALNPVLFETDVALFQNTLKRARRATDPFERRLLLEEALGHYGGDLLTGRYESWVLPEQNQLREQFLQATAELESLKGKSTTSTRATMPPKVVAEVATLAPLPLGTYTVFLAQGDAPILAEAQRLVVEQGGIAIPSPADTGCFVFADGHVALSVAVACMRVARPNLRIALDTGFLDVSSDYAKSPLLHTLTQLLRIAHRGQILCSDSAATLVWRRPHLNHSYSEYRLRDLGRYRIVQDSPAERLFQLEGIDEAPQIFPPLQAARGDAPLLPPTYTRFFGRQNELQQLINLLTEPAPVPPLITLNGLGGIGKTRLAQEAATKVQDSFSGRVWFVLLAELEEAPRIPDAIRDALRLPKDPNLDVLEQCVAFLSLAPSLLVLDNLEQFVAGGQAAEIIQNLRERVPSLVCLVTSRQMLGIHGERAFPVGPLLQSDTAALAEGMVSTRSLTSSEAENCVMLFEDRARAVRPDFRVTDTNFPVILRLCAVLEGIPLAIELAAARIGLLSPAQILSQMEGRFALLRSRRRDIPERHRSLWAAVDSSYQLLPLELRQVFARLSVFRGGWTLAAVQAVCFDQAQPDDWDDTEFVALEATAELQESSLIFTVGSDGDTPRFQMLETLREFAAEQLRKTEDETEALQRHREFFAQMAMEAELYLTAGESAQQWLDRLENDHDNLRAAMSGMTPSVQALRTATALHRFFLIRGHVPEGRKRLTALLNTSNIATNASESELAKAQNALGILACAVGALEEAREHFDQALMFYKACEQWESVARVLNNIGIVATQTGNFADARNSYEQSLSLYRTLGDTLRQSMVLTNLGGVLVFLSDYDAARRVLEECLPIQRAANDDFSLLRTLQNLSEVAIRQGDIDAAADALYDSLEIRRTLGDQFAFGDTLASASIILGKRNRMEDAAVAWTAAQALRASTDVVPVPASAEEENRWLEEIRQSLPSEIFAAMQQKGSRMNFDQAVAFVEGCLHHT